MKLATLLVLIALISATAPAQTSSATATPDHPQSQPQQPAPAAPQQPPSAAPAAKADDVKSMDSIIAAVYNVISGAAGQKRDWDRFQSLFIPGARLIPTFKRRDASVYTTRVLSPEEFATANQRAVQEQGFFESEVARRTEQWGNISQVFSTYESRHAPGDPPFARGINSFQLMNDGQRWWIVTIFWEGESKEVPLTPEMLKSK